MPDHRQHVKEPTQKEGAGTQPAPSNPIHVIGEEEDGWGKLYERLSCGCRRAKGDGIGRPEHCWTHNSIPVERSIYKD